MSLLRQSEIAGIGGSAGFIFPFGELNTGKKLDEVAVQFQYNYFDENFDVVLPSLVGTGTRGVTDSVAYVSGVAANDEATISSLYSIAYRPGHSGFIDFTAAAETNGGGDGKVWIGGYDTSYQNGFVLELNYTSSVASMNFGFLKNGVETGSNFSGGFDSVTIPSGLNVDELTIYRIAFGYLGVANPVLFCKIAGKWVLLHEVQTEGQALTTHVSTPVFPITITAFDEAKGYTASWNGGIIGDDSPIVARPFAFPNTLLPASTTTQGSMTLSGTTTGTIVILHSKTTFQSKTNSVKARLLNYGFTVDIMSGNSIGTVQFQIINVSTLSGTATYSDINATSSTFEYDHTANTGSSVNVTAGVPLLTESTNYSGSNKGGNTGTINVNAERIGAIGYADDTFAVVAKDLGGNNVTVRVSLIWEELF